jgi:hypothetical protein
MAIDNESTQTSIIQGEGRRKQEKGWLGHFAFQKSLIVSFLCIDVAMHNSQV